MQYFVEKKGKIGHIFLSFGLHVCYNKCKEKRELREQFSLDSYFAVAWFFASSPIKAIFLWTS